MSVVVNVCLCVREGGKRGLGRGIKNRPVDSEHRASKGRSSLLVVISGIFLKLKINHIWCCNDCALLLGLGVEANNYGTSM